MKRSARTGGGNVFDQLALRLREVVRAEQLNTGGGVERYKVNQLSPLVLEHLAGDLQLTAGDPDFSVGTWFQNRLTASAVAVGDVVWVLREDSEWHVLDVATA